MAELVDALVSNTSGSNAVPVRSRLRVHFQTNKALIHNNIKAFNMIVTETFFKFHLCCSVVRTVLFIALSVLVAALF
jgi:hypothetical protein